MEPIWSLTRYPQEHINLHKKKVYKMSQKHNRNDQALNYS